MPGPALLPPAALGVLIQLWRKYDYTNVLAAAVAMAHITRINPTTLNAYDDALLLINGVYKLTQIAPHCGLSSDLAVLAHEHGIAVALSAAYYHTLVVGNHNLLLLDGLVRQDGTRASLPLLDLRHCLVGREHLLVKQFQPGYTLGWLRARPQSPACGDAARCASPYFAASWTTAPLWGCTSSTRQGVRYALRRMRQGGGRGNWAGCRKVWEELPGFCDLPPWGGRGGMKNDEL
ncbi:hypothetical protein B0H14DRAFT_3650629 [Mycena olivaceomarginata]|nr:hypothetical protein B0H14DRAFT_3650629 [Mycena olivaceomarginata]